MKRRLTNVAAASALAILGGVVGLLDANARPDFSGTWKLNTDLSEDPREKMQEARGTSGGRGGGFGGGGRGGMGGGGAMRLGESLAAQKVLTISHKDPQLVVTDMNGRAPFSFRRVYDAPLAP